MCETMPKNERKMSNSPTDTSDSDVETSVRESNRSLLRINSIIDPSYAPKILRKNKSITRAESIGFLENASKVLVLYTGGTIGMLKGKKDVYEPRAGVLQTEIKKYPQLHDPHYANKKNFRLPECNAPLVLPNCGESYRIVYTIYEYEPLLDSSNMTVDDWINISLDIQNSYQHFNGFVILHGTDTMAYTASALSFMLENLGKTIVITGSQIPLFEPRSDGRENFLNSLIIAGNYEIPEVTILFNNKLFRGNRTSKISASNLDAFDSPNMPPLATIGININVNWNNVFRSPTIAKVCVHSILSRNVGLLRLFPSITVETVLAFLKEPIEGVVLQTYGSGNAPSNRADILSEFKNATNRGVIIVNITQCLNGKVTASYETGNALLEAGVICGSDMTPEAALTKLSYVLSKTEWSVDKKRKIIETNIRGELTIIKDMKKHHDIEIISSLINTLKISTAQEKDELRAALYPAIVCALTAKGDLDGLIKLYDSGVDLSSPDYDLRTPLHIAVINERLMIVEYLLSTGCNVHVKDSRNETPLQLAISHSFKDLYTRQQIIKILRQAGANLDLPKQKIGDFVTKAASKGDLATLKALYCAGASLNEIDSYGRCCLHIAVEKNQQEVVNYLINEIGVNLNKRDIYNKTAEDIALELKRINILNNCLQSNFSINHK